MKHKYQQKKAFKAAFPYTLPICASFLFLGISYGFFMVQSGFSPLFPMMMSAVIFAGSMEFVTTHLLLGSFNPVGAFLLALTVNARHLFYGISMLDRYKDVGKKKFYLIFGLCDESFSINCTADIPKDVDRGLFYFYVTLLNQLYWVFGASLGGFAGNLIPFRIEGLDFVMTALLVVLFLENWLKEKHHISSVIGISGTILCRMIFGSESFIIPSMIFILGTLTLTRKQVEKMEETVCI